MTRERSSSGEQPQARLMARAKELGDLYPRSKESSLIARVGLDSKRLLTRSTSICSRTSRNVFPVVMLTAISIVRLLTHNSRERSPSGHEGALLS